MKINDYMKITEAAEFLGVNPETLRNWEKAKKMVSFRHPISGYRLYKKEYLEQFLKDLGTIKDKE